MEAVHQRCGEPVLLIPVYDPDDRFPALLRKLKERFSRLVVVDDGSTRNRAVFDAVKPMVERVLTHPVNRGKGAAIKTGLAFLGAQADVITVDADGQHTLEDIQKIAEALPRQRRGLVVGVRDFGPRAPFRSRWGNWWTKWIFRLVTGLKIRDTQTGLRGIPAELVERVAHLPGERYEFEMVMLADARFHAAPPLQIPIATVYLEGNATSHFQPVRDTFRIFGALFQEIRRKRV